MFQQSSVRAKLSAAFGLLAVLVLLVSVLAIGALSGANARFAGYINGINARAIAAAQVRSAIDRRAVAARNIVLVSSPANLAAEKAAVLKAHADVGTALADLNARLAAAVDTSAGARALVAEITRVEGLYGPVALAIVELGLNGKRDDAIARIEADCRPLLAQLVKATDDYAAYTQEHARQLTTEAAESYERQRALLVVACVVAFASAAVAGVLISRSLSRALGAEPAQLGAAASRVAAGDLGIIVGAAQAPAGSVLASLGAMQGSLAAIVGQVRGASESIATGSTEIAHGNADLSQRTEEQASALQQTSATMTQLGVTVRSNSDSANQANRLARAASDVASRGGAVVGEVVETMREIDESSKRITDILGVIDGIAFQTNILALNAAVEAARAGPQGRGFAVVASEVRSLAQRSADAARDIKSLIGSSVERVERGTTLVDQAGATMGEIVKSIREVVDIVGHISAASQEQSKGISQVGDAVTQMDQVTQQNAALVEQSAAAAESLKQQAHQLVEAVAVFRLAA